MDAPTLTGQTLKGYLFSERIGTGSFGAVYRAVQATVDRAVAIKIILPVYANLPDFVRRFESEAQLVARLEHPHIVPLFDYWRDPDGAYLVMRMLPTSLRMILSDGPLPIQETARLSEQIASALAFSHRQGVVHRDIKPDNILMDDEGNAYLSDFGLAEVIQASSDKPDGSVTGSLAYMAPEQLRSEAATIQSDVYSLGVVLYEMLAGEHPYINLNMSELIQKQLLDPLPPLSVYRPDLPETVNAILQKATSKTSAERYPDVHTLVGAFRDALLDKNAVIDLTRQELVVENPYKGLRAFEEVDAGDFFGREGLIDNIIASMSEEHPLARFVAIVGPSGSGKSSVIQAGVIPALRRGALPNSDRWFVVNMVPSAHPITSLETLLLSVAVRPLPNLREHLLADDYALFNVVDEILAGTQGELVLVVDQFEELFTLVQNEAERAQFLKLIQVAVTDDNSRIRVIVNLRADFYDRPLLYEGFSGLIQARTQLVLPLTETELERAITTPAKNVGVQLEPNLVAAILSDVYAEPGALPLVQYALTEVFERRQGRVMTLEGYEAINRISGALARRADTVYAALTDEQKATARQMFLRLVTLGEAGTEEMRRRASRSELLSVIHDADRLEALLDAFGRHRLLSFDHEPASREPTVEVAHEALLREWRTLRRWLEEGREDVIQQRRLARLADDWLGAAQDPSFLLRGSQLELFEEWLAQTDIALTDQEAQFIRASIAEREAWSAEERVRQEREIALESRARRFQRWFVGVMFAAMVIAIMLSLIAFQQRLEAQAARHQAETNAEIAQTQASSAATAAAVASRRANELQSLALVTEAERAIGDANPDLALALLLEANRIPDAPIDAENLLSELVPTSTARLFSGHMAHIGTVAISPDSTRVLSGADNGRLILWDLAAGEALLRFEGHTDRVRSVAFLPDGTRAVSGADDHQVIVWDLTTGEPVHTLSGHADDVFAVAVSPDGTQIVSGSRDRSLILWDAASGAIIRQFGLQTDGHQQRITSVAFNPDGAQIVSGSADNSLIVWNAATGEVVARLERHTDSVNDVAFSPNGSYILSASSDMTLILWDTHSYTAINQLAGHRERVTSIAFSPDGIYAVSGAGNQFAGASTDNSLILWDLFLGQPLQRYVGHQLYVSDVAYSADGRHIVSASDDTTLRLWSATYDIEWSRATAHAGYQAVAFSTDGSLALTALADGHIELFRGDAVEGFTSLYHLDQPERTAAIQSAAVSHDGTHALLASADRTITLIDMATGVTRHTFEGHTNIINDVAFSPDGTLALSGSRDRSVILWDVATGEPVRTFEIRHTNAVNAVAYSPDGRLAASGSDDQSVIVWDVAAGTVKTVLRGHLGPVKDVVFSPDGLFVLSGSTDKTLVLWDIETGSPVRQYAGGHDDWVTAVALSSDGRLIASGSRDRHIVIWDALTAQIIRQDSGHASTVLALQFSSGNRYALSAALEGVIRLWPVSSPGILDWIAAHRYVRELTCDEREQYRLTPC